MLNFIIDTSVFSLSPQSDDVNTEKNNLCLLVNNITSLKKLQKNDSVTVSYMNEIFPLLKNNRYLSKKSQIKSRISDLLSRKPEYYTEIGQDEPTLENWDDFLYVISPKEVKTEKRYIRYKGKIGIFNNIPDRDRNPSEGYIRTTDLAGANKIYPKLPHDFLKTFKKYCGYIADLNIKYQCFDNNFIVLGEYSGILEKNSYSIILSKGINYIQSRISIIGIQNAETLCLQKMEYKDMKTACIEAIKEFSKRLDFGKEINDNNIQANLFPIAGTPERIYRYLETLYNISELIVNESINIINDVELIELLNSYGLLCSPEDEKYEKNKCKYRKFLNKLGKKQFFNIHLKPSTSKYNAPDENDINYTLASKNTVRIYLNLDNSEKKFFLGWIGHHPPFCKDCDNSDCQEYHVDYEIK